MDSQGFMFVADSAEASLCLLASGLENKRRTVQETGQNEIVKLKTSV